MDYILTYEGGDELYHHGIKGMKWGVRRYQNYDGTMTKKGLQRYRDSEKEYNDASAKVRDLKSQYKSIKPRKAATKEERRALRKERALAKDNYRLAKGDKSLAKKKMSEAYDNLKDYKQYDEGKRKLDAGQSTTKNTVKSIGASLARDALNGVIHATLGDTMGSNLLQLGTSVATGCYTYELEQSNKQIEKYREVEKFRSKWG